MRTAKEIEEALAKVGTAERAAGSKRYLKSSLRLLGASVPEMRACAAFLLDYRVDLLGPADLPAIKRFVASSETWALVDPLSSDLLGHLLLAHPDAATKLDPWIRDRSFWVRRAALLSQIQPLKAGAEFDRLAGWADAMLDEREFFIRKAIGWVLREAGKKRAKEVHEWLLPRGSRASGVTTREAVKYLEPHRREAILAART